MWTLSLTADRKVLLLSVVRLVQRNKRETTPRNAAKPQSLALHPDTAREKRDSHHALPSIAREEGCG